MYCKNHRILVEFSQGLVYNICIDNVTYFNTK